MRIKIWTSVDERSPTTGPYKMLDIVERGSPYEVCEITHFGEVLLIPPPIRPFTDDVEQSVIVKADPTRTGEWCEESVFEKPPTSYAKIQFFPISVGMAGLGDDPPLTGPYAVLPSENLTIENVSHLITAKTFSLWKNAC